MRKTKQRFFNLAGCVWRQTFRFLLPRIRPLKQFASYARVFTMGRLTSERFMTIIVVLFNLKAGVQASTYEAWAKSTDLPTVNSLKSVDQCRLLRTSRVMGSELPSPYQYIETIEVNSFAGFQEDLNGPLMQRITEEFNKFADKPLLIVSQELP